MSGRAAALAFLACAALWLATLGVRPLYKSDESRYAEIPREMVTSGDWLTPRLNGFKYFEKPPLQYWATAAAFTLLGASDWAARLWTALTGLLGLVLAYHAGNRLFRKPAGLYAAAILAGCPLYVVLGQVNTLDMGLAVFLSGAVFAFALGHMLVFWAACALAVLTKGLVGIVLPAGLVGLYVLLKRDFRLLGRMRPLSGALLFLAIAAPWFVAVSMANDEFAHFFFIQEHFQRFTTRMHGRYQPPWYFLPILAFGLAPWLLVFIASLRQIASRPPQDGFDARLFLGLWVAIVFVFFSASSSKLPSYILPLFPAAAVLLGSYVAAAQPVRLLRVQAILVSAGAIALALLAPKLTEGALEPYTPWLAGALVLAAAAGVGAAFLRDAASIVLALALGAFASTQLALAGHRVIAPLYSTADLIARAGPLRTDVPVYAFDAYDHTLPWYLRRTVTMVQYADELEKSISWEPQKFIRGEPQFAERWKSDPAAYVFVSIRHYERLAGALPMVEIARDPRYVLARKP